MNKKVSTKLTNAKKIKIRNDFVQGISVDDNIIFPTLDELIKKYKVAQSTVYRVARNENWKIQKEQFYNEYTKKLDAKRSNERAEKSKKIDDNSVNLAEAVFATIAQVISKNNKDMQNGKIGLPPSQLTSIAQAISITQKVAKLALGEATHNIDATINENNEAFKRAMELLDTVEESRSRSVQTTH